MCTYRKRISANSLIDANLTKQIQVEENYWREVLKRIIATIKLLSKLGIAFRGNTNDVFSDSCGNYLSCLHYLSEFDDFLKHHIKMYANCGSGKSNYLSSHTCDEFIELIGEKTREKLLSEIREAGYFSIILDSTPDISHIDQLAVIIRYVTSNSDIKETFIGFIKITQHNSLYLEEVILKKLEDLSLDIKMCRGQSYDNAANMKGIYTGLQARLKNHSPSAHYIPCCSHSLNLIGNYAAESCAEAVYYFCFVQKVYNYFSASTRRWDILLKHLEKKSLTVKRLSDTRWSARADAISALKRGYKQIKEALLELSISPYEKPVSKLESSSLAENFDNLETAILTVLWDKILQRINATSKSLQDPDMELLTANKLLQSLGDFILDIRNSFDALNAEANLLTDETQFKDGKKRKKKRKKMCDEDLQCDDDNILHEKKNFIVNTLNVICDKLIMEIKERTKSYLEILDIFDIFLKRDIDHDKYMTCITKIIQTYKTDIDSEKFTDEVKQFLRRKFLN